jgi:predicted  nucleic acid-binding Zn-ribbon protein
VIKKELNSIYEIISHLQNDDLKVDDIAKTLKVLVVRSKAEVIDTISKESQKKPLPAIANYDDVVKTAELSSHTLKKIGDVLGKHSRVIHVFAKKYAQDLKNHLEVVTNNHVRISKMIAEYDSLESSSAAIKEKITKILKTNKEITDAISHATKLQDSFIDYERLISSTQEKIANLFGTKEYAKFLQYREQINKVSTEENSLNKEINDEFSKISRPLGKYVYVTSLEKPLKLLLERLVENPATAVLENKDSIVTILESCMKGILSGTVSVKETDKSVEHITHVLSLLDGFISQKNKLRAQLQELQQQLVIFDLRQLEDLEKRLAKAKSDNEDARIKIKTLESDLKQQMDQRNRLVEELEGLLERTLGAKYTIKLE